MVGEKVVLVSDVFSNFNGKKGKEHYGKKGDEVEIISESFPAVIVKGKDGNIFTTNQRNISYSI